jgi:hypothetical protein
LKAFKIEPVEVDPRRGIFLGEYADVLDELYQETNTLRIRLERQ